MALTGDDGIFRPHRISAGASDILNREQLLWVEHRKAGIELLSTDVILIFLRKKRHIDTTQFLNCN
jgi:hypothetical protein